MSGLVATLEVARWGQVGNCGQSEIREREEWEIGNNWLGMRENGVEKQGKN